MLPLAPLPTWSHLLRALLRSHPTDVLGAPWRRGEQVCGLLSRSAWSLALIALWRQRATGRATATVWVPDFFCNASLAPLRAMGARLFFYPVQEDAAPDLAACRGQADVDPPDLLVLVHYFGRPVKSAAVRDFCARRGAWLVEDAAHVLRPTEGIGAGGDFVLYSPHKHLPLPDGAVLVLSTEGPCRLGADQIASFDAPDTWPVQLDPLRVAMGGAVRGGALRTATWLAKRVAQRLGAHQRWRTDFAEPENGMQRGTVSLPEPAPSALGRRLMGAVLDDLAAIARKRLRNQLRWDALCDELGGGALPRGERPEHGAWTPYLAAYRLESDAAQRFDLLQGAGMPVTTWPDLPPEVAADREGHPRAWELRHGRVYLPVHQSLSGKAMAQLLPLAKDGPSLHLTLEWDRCGREQWQQWLLQAGRSNLLQSWGYGAAKADGSGWRVRRGVFFLGGEPVALMQVLEKRVLGVVAVLRLNRGPLPLRPLDLEERRALWREVTGLGCLMRGRLLSWAPESRLVGSSLLLADRLGLRQYDPFGWESVWLDLQPDLETLRKRLDGKWRNMLVASEKNGLTLAADSGESAFNWMLARYRELMNEKDFEGPPVAFLERLRRHLEDEEQLVVLRAMQGDEAVAGICLARHGAAATYLLGWNGSEGRRLKANQYLLWQAVVQLKEEGMRWFDLGGISPERTPGITSFKLGMNGERYELVGEFWKW